MKIYSSSQNYKPTESLEDFFFNFRNNQDLKITQQILSQPGLSVTDE